MSYAYTPSPAPLPGSVTLPDDGDPPVAADTGGPDEIMLDALKNLENAVLPGADFDRTQAHCSAADSEWGHVAGGNRTQQNEEPGGESLTIHCDLPHGGTWIGASVTISPIVAGRAGLPSVLPSVSAWRKRISTGVSSSVAGAVNDPSASVVAYEAAHDIPISIAGPNNVVDRELYTYYLLLSGEGDGGGVNYHQFLQYVIATTTTTVDTIDGGAS